ncbi:MAG TPA: S8 family serine peptidase [Gemmatimonas sp.]|nr:S8 family serine peptidase [Gemmatimonas sp.]
MMRLSLEDPPFATGTGEGVTIAVVDSGVHADHPHIGGRVIGGVCTLPHVDSADWVDRIGHGTAVAAAIHEKAPLASLLAVRVFDKSLTTSAQALADGIVWAADNRAHLINLSLGTTNLEHVELLNDAVAYASARGATVVSARESNGQRWLPGSLDGVIGVLLDPECERNHIGYVERDGAGEVYAASGYPRPIPGVPVERNLSGISFAVANVTGFLARMRSAEGSR